MMTISKTHRNFFTPLSASVRNVARIGVLLSGYGVLFHSEENVGGLGLKCQYLTARGVSTALYVHSDSGVIGVSSCPLLRKSTTVVDNG
ncbi:YobH family protein [Klebsiella pneumoniae]|uniref:YobH family protein n=1 Tax=Klebsiella pneumoniae TaxID=573 RepID=UPI001F5B7F75|nr:YobH family protein [Klebsiella pneumoniae]MCL0639995.1 YobH family protein [Klebsiella pneumoniae]